MCGHMYVYAHMCMCIYVNMYACVYMCAQMCMCVLMGMYVCLCVYVWYMCTHVLQIPCREVCRNISSGERHPVGERASFNASLCQSEWDRRRGQKGYLPAPVPPSMFIWSCWHFCLELPLN